MGNQVQIPLVANTSEQDIAGRELLVNVYPKASTGGKYQFTLKGTPGLAFFLELPTFPVIGLHTGQGRSFAVTPSKLYEIFADGSYKTLGDVDLSGRVSMANNGIHLVMVDGLKGFFYNAQDGTVNRIISDGFYPSSTVAFQDGYFIFERRGTGQFFISGLYSINFDPTDFGSAEGQPDNLVAVISDHRELFLFGEKTIEVWYNFGGVDFPFERNQGAFSEKGCAAAHSVTKQNNTIYFVGSDLVVYQIAGYIPAPISNVAVEKSLENTDLSDCFAYTYQFEGALFYILTIPSKNLTWGYDTTLGTWHIREDYHFGRHRSNNSIFFDNKTLVGDFQSGRIFQLAANYYTDDKDPIVRKFVLPTVNIGRDFISVSSFELDMSTGVGLTSGQGSNPVAWCEFSKDKGKTWSNLKDALIGKIGNYLNRVKWNRFGTARQFDLRVTISDPVPIDIGGAWVEVD